MTRNETLGKILRRGFVPIVIHDRLPPLECLQVVLEAGIEAMEISCRHPQALALIEEAKRRFPELAVGAATLIEDGRLRAWINATGRPVPAIDEVVDAGADFLVSLLPFREATYERHAHTHVIISGVATPGEGQQALDWGANLLKFVNPRLLGGPDYFRGLDPATYKSFPFFVTGGMRPELLPGYIEANILAVGAGFDLILGDDYAGQQDDFRPADLREALAAYVGVLEEARAQFQPDIPFATGDAVAIAAASGRCLNVETVAGSRQ